MTKIVSPVDKLMYAHRDLLLSMVEHFYCNLPDTTASHAFDDLCLEYGLDCDQRHFLWVRLYLQLRANTRYALVRGNDVTTERVAAYLPRNYKVVCTASAFNPVDGTCDVVLIEGKDSDGWTLDDYVIPRLGSGMMAVEEVDLTLTDSELIRALELQ